MTTRKGNILSSTSASLVVAGALAIPISAAFAQEKKFDLGKHEYDSNCATCHGIKGKGDGPYKPYLIKSPPDLTGLSKKNGGVFPLEKVESIIDGRQEIGAHGPRNMPIWGTEYDLKAFQAYFGSPSAWASPYDPESYVWARIMALTEYIYRLQEK